MTLKERYDKTIAYFEATRPEAKTELVYHGDPFLLLVAVVLSAQCTDKRVNMVTPALFAAYPTPAAMAAATQEELFAYVRSVSYPNAKSTHLLALAQKLTRDFGGVVPDDAEALQTLPGVGRKTANVVCSVIYRQPRMAVDTHVFRVANRIGLTRDSKTPLQTEQTLTRHIPRKLIPQAHHWLILHGRYVCTARRPHCADCGLQEICLYCQKAEKAKAAEAQRAEAEKAKAEKAKAKRAEIKAVAKRAKAKAAADMTKAESDIAKAESDIAKAQRAKAGAEAAKAFAKKAKAKAEAKKAKAKRAEAAAHPQKTAKP